MVNDVVRNSLSIVNGYLVQCYSKKELNIIYKEIDELISGKVIFSDVPNSLYSYEEIQSLLSAINEKEAIRKTKGVYYTPQDVVKFILFNSIKMVFNKLKSNNLHVLDLNGIPFNDFCYKKTVYDPTCGSGVFLLAALELKLDLLDLHTSNITKLKIHKIVNTIRGNDLNIESITITKIRLLISVLHRYGVSKIKGLSKVLNNCFMNYDYVLTKPSLDIKYDIIVGNPPYVEDSKSKSVGEVRYGNIYANVLENAAFQLKAGGVIGFIIPLSYVSTPRMKKIRDKLYVSVPEQYILSYSDRPDCLFTSVHQKLCILFGHNNYTTRNIYTSNYQYWYKEERKDLFNKSEVVKNDFAEEEYIPKLGTQYDINIYIKIISQKKSINNLLDGDNVPFYLNMRAAFWIKAFLNEHSGSEYKKFGCEKKDIANFCMCLLNSSLFWWYWICVSDCWHITKKELNGFKVPNKVDFMNINKLAEQLEYKLEKTKVFVGTKQTEYEYKHKECIDVIHQIDDYINQIYGLTEEEGIYVKNFAYRYRIGGGVKIGCN